MKRKRPVRPVAADRAGPNRAAAADSSSAPRIIGGQLRGRKLIYQPDPRTRPMKDRVREAVFNLIGPAVKETHVLDLFAGTGALGIEALSRGAASAIFVERHFPTAELIRENLAVLEVADRATVLPANVLLWPRRLPPILESPPPLPSGTKRPWLVFCSPPWELFAAQPAEMVALLETLLARAPAGSLWVVEADERWDFGKLPRAEHWSIRAYPPAVIGILKT